MKDWIDCAISNSWKTTCPTRGENGRETKIQTQLLHPFFCFAFLLFSMLGDLCNTISSMTYTRSERDDAIEIERKVKFCERSQRKQFDGAIVCSSALVVFNELNQIECVRCVHVWVCIACQNVQSVKLKAANVTKSEQSKIHRQNDRTNCCSLFNECAIGWMSCRSLKTTSICQKALKQKKKERKKKCTITTPKTMARGVGRERKGDRKRFIGVTAKSDLFIVLEMEFPLSWKKLRNSNDEFVFFFMWPFVYCIQ